MHSTHTKTIQREHMETLITMRSLSLISRDKVTELLQRFNARKFISEDKFPSTLIKVATEQLSIT